MIALKLFLVGLAIGITLLGWQATRIVWRENRDLGFGVAVIFFNTIINLISDAIYVGS